MVACSLISNQFNTFMNSISSLKRQLFVEAQSKLMEIRAVDGKRQINIIWKQKLMNQRVRYLNIDSIIMI